jgi:hypothetical protein
MAGISTIDPEVPESVLMVRVDFSVNVIRVLESPGVFMARLLQGASLGRAAEHTLRSHPDFNLTETLKLLIHQHTLTFLRRSIPQ